MYLSIFILILHVVWHPSISDDIIQYADKYVS